MLPFRCSRSTPHPHPGLPAYTPFRPLPRPIHPLIHFQRIFRQPLTPPPPPSLRLFPPSRAPRLVFRSNFHENSPLCRWNATAFLPPMTDSAVSPPPAPKSCLIRKTNQPVPTTFSSAATHTVGDSFQWCPPPPRHRCPREIPLHCPPPLHIDVAPAKFSASSRGYTESHSCLSPPRYTSISLHDNPDYRGHPFTTTDRSKGFPLPPP